MFLWFRVIKKVVRWIWIWVILLMVFLCLICWLMLCNVLLIRRTRARLIW